MNNVIKTSSKGARQGGIGLKNILDEGIFTNVIYYSEFADGRKYVGQTCRGLFRRHKEHLHQNHHYDNVLKAHMDEAMIYPICFGVEDIEDIDTIDLLNGLEVAEIMLRETFNDVDPENGLNHTTGGYSYEVSEATKQKLSDYWVSYWNSEEGQKQKEEYTKYWASEEGQKQKEKHSKLMEDYYNSEEGQKQKEKNSQNMIEYWASEEGQKQKEKNSQNMNKYWTEEKREEQRNVMFERYGYDVNIEDIRKMIDEGLTNKEIAEKIGCSSTLATFLRIRGLPSIKQLRNKSKTHWVKNNENKYSVDKVKTGYRIREKNHTTIINKISNEERANELCNMLNNNDLTLKELRKMKLKGQI